MNLLVREIKELKQWITAPDTQKPLEKFARLEIWPIEEIDGSDSSAVDPVEY